MIKRFLILGVTTGLCVSCTAETPTAQDADVTIMTFNVENLFDNVDDPGKDDKSYLPIAAKQNETHIAECNEIPVASWREDCLSLDWSDDIIEFKLSVIADTIRQIDGGADVIAFQEIENVAILERLSSEYLADLEYAPAILIEGQDLRGIDVAFLSRLPLLEPAVLHPLTFADFPDREGDTRGVLQASFELPGGGTITGLAVHFPAPFHPTEMRVAAYEHLAAIRQQLPDDHHVFAAGDFNTTSAEDAETGILGNLARPDWTIAHELGCDDCKGTQYYARDDSWSFLDMIFWSPARGENATWGIRADSVMVRNQNPAQVSVAGTPERFNAIDRRGVSDHWPLSLTIETAEKQ